MSKRLNMQHTVYGNFIISEIILGSIVLLKNSVIRFVRSNNKHDNKEEQAYACNGSRFSCPSVG